MTYWQHHSTTPIATAASREVSNKKPYSAEAARREAIIIRQLLNYAHSEGIISKIPIVQAPNRNLANIGETNRGIFEDRKVYKRMLTKLQHLQQRPPEPHKIRYDLMRKRRLARIRFWILLLSNTGIRPQEARRLRHDQIKLEPDTTGSGKSFTVINLEKRQSKNNRAARQILSRDYHLTYFHYIKYKKWLEDYDPELCKPTGFIFPSFRRKDEAWDCQSAIRRFLIEIDMHLDDKGKPRSSYSLRHFYITMRLEANTPIHCVAWNCGTSYDMLYRTYSHLLTWNMREYLTRNSDSPYIRRELAQDREDTKILYGDEITPEMLGKLYT